MWVERHPNQFSNGDTIAAVNRGSGARYEGNVHRADNSIVYINLHDENATTQFSSYYYKFYGWSTSGKPAVDESKIRLHAPISKPCICGDETCQEDECPAHPGVRHEKTTRCDVQVGNQTYVLSPGDHLRVWWEDGALWSELVQGS